MIEKFKQPWLDKLRDPDTKQCRERLYDGFGYCCLGVLLKTVGVSLVNPNGWYEAADLPDGYRADEGETLNSHAKAFFGLRHEEVGYLVMMNDGGIFNGNVIEPQSFTAIADWIERNL